MWFKVYLGVLASIKKEWCLLYRGVDIVVVCKLCEWKECIPVVLSFPNKDVQVLLKLLVNMFSLPISLRMVCCG